ncbi:hypothetical protein EJB05_04181 [Eragrostis curvula]|uniref:Uncharacterized protein n=1 Tax=Eragrostis curvula TaxID=38414 RepID=A0A5J9W8T7_9POAL|nr:hypothetical protein EJB05_04181 [Eragrostis curvula]
MQLLTCIPPAATAPRLRYPLSISSYKPRRRLLVVSAQSNFPRVVQAALKVGKDAVEAATNLVPGSVPRPIARIGVTIAAVLITLFLLKSIVSTAFFVLAMMGLIYLGFLAMNPKEVTGSKVDETSSEDPVEEARRIMEKYK